MQLVFYKGLRGITFIAGGIFRKNLALGALYTNVHPNIIQTRKQMLHTSIAVLEHGVWGWGFEMFPRVWGLESRHFQTLKFISQNWNCHREGRMGHFSYFTCTSALESPTQADLILLSFSLLHFADTVGVFLLFVCLFTNWRFMATLHRTSYQHHFFQQHWLTLQFKLFHYYLCYCYPWSVIFDIITKDYDSLKIMMVSIFGNKVFPN